MKKILFHFIFLIVYLSVSYAGNVPFKVGTCNEYKYYNNDGTVGSMKMSVVGKEGNGYWIENVSKDVNRKTDKTVVKMLMVQEKDKTKITRMIIKSGTEPAKEMDENMMNMTGMKSGSYISDMKNIKDYYNKQDKNQYEITEKNNVTIKTPAGSFKTKYIKVLDKKSNSTTEVYQSENVQPAGIVKSLVNGQVQMELIKVISKGAKSEITEKPEKMNMPKIPNMQDLMKQMKEGRGEENQE